MFEPWFVRVRAALDGSIIMRAASSQSNLLTSAQNKNGLADGRKPLKGSTARLR